MFAIKIFCTDFYRNFKKYRINLFENLFANMFLFENENRTRTKIVLLFANKNRTRTKISGTQRTKIEQELKKYACSSIPGWYKQTVVYLGSNLTMVKSQIKVPFIVVTSLLMKTGLI